MPRGKSLPRFSIPASRPPSQGVPLLRAEAGLTQDGAHDGDAGVVGVEYRTSCRLEFFLRQKFFKFGVFLVPLFVVWIERALDTAPSDVFC